MGTKNRIQLIFTLIMATLFLGACGDARLIGGIASKHVEEVPSDITYLDGVSEGETRIFVTQDAFPSNFSDVPGALSGVDGADRRCQQAAQTSGLQKNYRALLGSSTRSPASIIPFSSAIFMLLSSSQRIRVASTADQLWSASTQPLLAIPNMTENYESLMRNPIDNSLYNFVSGFNGCNDVELDLQLGSVGFPYFLADPMGIACLAAPEFIAQLIYSGVTENGLPSVDHCSDWTLGSGSVLSNLADGATVGLNSSQDRNWIYAGVVPCANLSAHLYCVSQD